MSNYDKCHECGSWVPRGETECPHCGSQQGVVSSLKGMLKQLRPQQTERKAGQLCVSCNKLVGMGDEVCPYCGVTQTSTRKAARAMTSILPADLSATHAIIFLLAALFLLPVLARSGDPSFEAGRYLGRGDPVTGYLMGALWSEAVAHGQYWRIVTASYLHFGIMHLAFNAYALNILGRLTEQLYGRGWFIFFYVITGIGAFTLSYLGHDVVMTAGASGPIFGLIGLGIVFCWRNRFANQQLLRTLVMWTVLSVVIGLALPVDNWAHGGGFITGAACGWLLPPELVTRGSAMNAMGRRLGWVSAAIVAGSFILCLMWAGSAQVT